MPAKSKKQQMAAGASLKGASKSMYKSMSERELRDMAKTKREGLRTRKSESSRK